MKLSGLITLAALCLIGFCAGAMATPITETMMNNYWNASNTKDFGTGGNWLSGSVPGTGDIAAFEVGTAMNKPAKAVNINHTVYGVLVPKSGDVSKWSFHGKGSVVSNAWVDDLNDDYVFTVGDGDFTYAAPRWGQIQVSLAGTMDFLYSGRSYTIAEDCTFTGLLHLIDGGWDAGATQSNIALAADGAWGRGGVLLDDNTKLNCVADVDQTHPVPMTLAGSSSVLVLNDNVDITVSSLSINGSPVSPGSYTSGLSQITWGTDTSVTVLPEPASLTLLAAGGAALLRRKRRK